MKFSVITDWERNLPIYVDGVGTQLNQEHIIREKGFYTYQWSYCRKGKGIFIIDNNEYCIKAGDGFFFYPNIPHEYYALEEPWTIDWLIFNGMNVLSLMKLFRIQTWEVFNLKQTDDLINQYNTMVNIFMNDNDKVIFDTSPLLYKFLYEFSKIPNRLSTSFVQSINDKISPVINLMKKEYYNDLSLEDLAKEINVSTYYLCKLFKKAYSITPIHYLIQIRIKKAKELLLENKELKVSDVGEMVGYKDMSYFCSIFKKSEGITPLQFRKFNN